MQAVQGKKKNKAANFVIQGSILAMAGILVRIIGMLYRMPIIRTRIPAIARILPCSTKFAAVFFFFPWTAFIYLLLCSMFIT